MIKNSLGALLVPIAIWASASAKAQDQTDEAGGEVIKRAIRPGAMIALIDMEKAFLAHPGREGAEARAEKARKDARQAFIDLSNELKELLQQHQEVTASIASGGGDLEAKREKASELLKAAQAKEIEVAKLRTTQERDLEKLFLEERGKLMDEIRAAAAEHNSGAKYNLVLDRSAVRSNGIPLVVDAQELPDITEAVIAILKKKKAESERGG